jgi:glyoxylase-like metal-dependent hydrolase (beta-lactamase superfamily II)
VLVPDLDARILAGEKVVDGKLPGSWPKNVNTVPDVRLTGGERIGSLEVVQSPGHSPGHVSFLDTRDRTLLAGDVYTSYGRVETTTKFYWRFPLAYFPTWDKAIDLESARALRALDPNMLLVGHGPATSNPGEAMDHAIARAEG